MTTIAEQSPMVRTGSIPGTGAPFPLPEYQRRLDAVIAKFDSLGIDGLAATSNASQRYLTGYGGFGAYFMPFPVVVTAGRKPTYVVRTYDEDAIRAQSWLDDVIPYTHQDEFTKAWTEALRRHHLAGARLGLELGSWNLSPADVSALQSHLPGLKIVDATRLVPSVAAVKSDLEIDAMRASMKLSDLAIRKFYEIIRPGVTEQQAADAMSAAVTEAGGTLHIAVLAFGARTALPHAAPDTYAPLSTYALERDQPAMTEVGGVKSGYAAGICRSVVLGRHAEAERLHEVAQQALAAAIAAFRPGAPMGDMDAAVRRVLSEAGLAAAFRHRTGYQNGFGGWTYRGGFSLEPGATDVIERGMTFHMPIHLWERGRFCVGTSQTVVVTESGAEPLSTTAPTLYHVD